MDINHVKMFMKCHLSSVISYVLTLPKKSVDYGTKTRLLSRWLGYLQAKWISDNLCCSCWGLSNSLLWSPQIGLPFFFSFLLLLLDKLWQGDYASFTLPCSVYTFYCIIRWSSLYLQQREMRLTSIQNTIQKGTKWRQKNGMNYFVFYMDESS